MAKVFISGLGVVSALGVGARGLFSALAEGRSGVRAVDIPLLQAQIIKTAAHFFDFVAAEHFKSDAYRGWDRFTQFAMLAAEEAVEQSGISPGTLAGERTAVIIGTGAGGATSVEDTYRRLFQTGERIDPFMVPRVMPNAAASHLTIKYRARGPSFAISSACSSSSQAIGLSLGLLRSGQADRAIVGGAEALLTAANFRAWESLRVMTPTLCRPFSAKRDGMVLGEGAAVFLLETERALVQRGGSPLAELAGYGTTSDAADLLRPNAAEAARAMSLAIADAGLSPRDIDYVNAHGTATVANDRTESEALRLAFGEHLGRVAVSSTKPIHGHTLGAAGAIELACAIWALRSNVAPPTLNWLGPEEHCIPNPVPNTGLSLPIAAAMSNSFAFGGINAALVVRKA